MIKRWLKILSFITLIIIPSLSFARPLNDAIVAIVNNEVITLKDLKDYVGSIYRQLKIEHRSPQEIQQVMGTYEEKGVNQLIEDKIILAAALAKGIEIRPEVVNKRIKEIKVGRDLPGRGRDAETVHRWLLWHRGRAGRADDHRDEPRRQGDHLALRRRSVRGPRRRLADERRHRSDDGRRPCRDPRGQGRRGPVRRP